MLDEPGQIMMVVRWLTSLAADLERALAADFIRQFATFDAAIHEELSFSQVRIQRVCAAIINSTHCAVRVAKPKDYEKIMADIGRTASTLKGGNATNDQYSMGFSTLQNLLQVSTKLVLAK